MRLSQIPNLITISRFVLVFPLAYFLLLEQYQVALLIFILAGVSDSVDGFLAKQFHWVSRIGSILDPLADKALLVVTMAMLTWHQHLSLLLFLVVVIRDLYIIAGASYYYYRVGPYQMQPSRLSKVNTFIQLLLVSSLLFSLGYMALPELMSQVLIGLTYLTCLASAIHYTLVWRGKLKAALAEKKRSG